MQNDDPIAFLITWSTYGTGFPVMRVAGSNIGMASSCQTRSWNLRARHGWRKTLVGWRPISESV